MSQQSAEWTAYDELTPRCEKMPKPAGKAMASVFWNAHDIIFIDYLKKEKKSFSYDNLLASAM